MANQVFEESNQPPCSYARPPSHDEFITEDDVHVAMRDGVRLLVDVYRPASKQRIPALLSFGAHSKDLQGPHLSEAFPPQPAWSSLWIGHLEAGDTRFFVSRGYAHVIASPRGMHGSDGGGARDWDSYDLIEWIFQQPWCNGEIGMLGIGAFAAEQFYLAKQHPPHLKCLFAYDGRGIHGPLGNFRDEYPGGVIHLMRYLQEHLSGLHQSRGTPGELPPQEEVWWREALENPDYRMYPQVLNVLLQKGEHMRNYFNVLINPYVSPAEEQSERVARQISVPAYVGSGWYAYTYKMHQRGAEDYFDALGGVKRLLLTGPSHLDRPLRSLRAEALRWYDHWLKGMDTGLMAEPAVKYWLPGANEWRSADAWPPAGTTWQKLYLNSWERLSPTMPVPASVDDFVPPDAFVQMPPTQTNLISSLRYLSEPMGRDVLVAGPLVLNLFAAIDQADTNWIVIIKDVGPDYLTRSARDGEREYSPAPERELTRGWLKASMRALDPDRSKPWAPRYRLTRESRREVTPGDVMEYCIAIMSTANLFRRGHRICLEICSHDMPSGVSGATNVEYIPYHICSSKTTLHKIFHDARYPSHLLMPVIDESNS